MTSESMTYRERRERKAERLREWAEKRNTKADALRKVDEHLRHDWAFITQPGHIPARARMNARDERAYEHGQKAADMRSRAFGIADQLDHAIYSDDPDAVERLQERIASLEAERDAIKARNAEFRKAHRAELKALGSAYQRDRAMPHQSYELANLSGNIARQRKRLAELQAPRRPRSITARRDGECVACDQPIRAGVVTITEVAPGVWVHAGDCSARMLAVQAEYAIKCDDCKIEIGRTTSVRESAEGGMCAPCRERVLSVGAIEIVRGPVVTRYYYSYTDDLGRRAYTDYSPQDGRGQCFFAVPHS